MGVENRDSKVLRHALFGAVALAFVQIAPGSAQEKPNPTAEITATPVIYPDATLIEPSGPITPFNSTHAFKIAAAVGFGLVPMSLSLFLFRKLIDKL